MKEKSLEEVKSLKEEEMEKEKNKNEILKSNKESSFTQCILYHFLFSLKLFILKYTFSKKVSITNFIIWKSIFGFILSIISIILEKKRFNKPPTKQYFICFIIRICGPFFSLLFLILMIKNIKLFSIGLILSNSLFSTIINKNKMFIVINLIGLLLSGFSKKIFIYLYIFGHIVISFFCIYIQGILIYTFGFSIENQNLYSNLISIIIGIVLSLFNKKLNFNIITICFALIYVSLSFIIEKNVLKIKGNKYFLLLNIIFLINLYLLGIIIFKENISILDIISIILLKVYEFIKLISSKKEKEKSE